MRSNSKKITPELFGYSVPRLHKGKKWYVDYLAFDPACGELKRKKHYIPALPKNRDRIAFANELIFRLTTELRNGWNPWTLTKSDRSHKLFDDVLTQYLAYLRIDNRDSTVKSYRSRVNKLREFMSSIPRPPKYCYEFNKTFCVDFLDWIVTDNGAGARTRNNYRNWLGTLAGFMIERDMLSENPVATIRNMKEGEKIRQPLNEVQLRQLLSYLREHDKPYLLACMFEYYTFIRPGELRHLKVGYVSVKEQRVFVPANVSKNKRDGYASLNKPIIELLIELGYLSKPGEWYLFGEGLRPGPDILNPDYINRRFAELRKILKFPSNLKFYSLKDSGIRDLADAAGIVTARDQARHTDIATTNKYLQGKGRDAPEKAKNFEGAL